MASNMYNGVRAEPKFLRDPTSFESISSGISRISSYVASNLPKRKSTSMTSPFDPHYQHYQAQQQQAQQQAQQQQQPAMIDDVLDDMDDVDTVTFASFEKLEYQDKTMSCLLLGYHDGFQLWDITNPDNVHELVSIRDKDTFGVVSFIHILQGQQEPVLAIISETTTTTTNTNLQQNSSNEHAQTHNRMNSNSSTSTTSTMASSHLIIYSLKSQSIIKEINDFGEEDNDDTVVVTCIKSNHKVIVLGCLSRHRSLLRILSAADYTPFATPLTDIYHDPNQGPIFTLGSRFIAYATNTAVLNSDPVMTSLTNKSISYSVLQGDKDVKGAAKDIAKEVVSGMKTLSEFGFNTLQNYFGNQPQPQPQGPPPPQEIYDGASPSNRRTSLQNSSPKDNVYITSSSSSNSAKKMVPSGMIMIRDILKLPKTPTRNLSVSIIAHFRPHTHPVSCLTFNQAGTLLMSASKQGHTFHIFSILTNTVHGNASHLYSLSRGITDAQVVDCQFSVDSTWCAITTARGTTHVYAINPYGGKPEISGHVHGKVNNPVYHPLMANSSKSKPKATTLSSVVRIKQRRKMPGNSLNSSQDDLGKFVGQQGQNPSGYSHGYYGPTPPQYIPSMMPPSSAIIHRNISKEPRAKIVAMFVTASKSPYPVNNSVYKSNLLSHNSLSSNSDSPNANPLGSIKQQATSMLSSFGSSMSHLPYMPTSGSQQSKKWDKNNSSSDTLMFGFDEEYDDSTKMINDEVGYQDMYSFHPDGVLTLHRCWVAKTVVKKRENGRTLEKLDLSLKEEDVAEWRVARNADWDQVRLSVDPSSPPSPTEESNNESQGSKKKKNKANSNSQKQTFAVDTRQKKLWLSNAEITTYTNDEPALWTHHQFSFQTYQDTKDLQRVLNAGIIPKTDTLIMLKGMPEPVSSRIDRVRKTTTRIANDSVEENMEDALAELEDNISKAMQTSFSPSSNSMGNSPATNLKWLSSSANAAMNASPSPSMTNRSFLDRNSSLSFEDAYLINMGSGPSPEPSMHGHTPQQQQQSQQALDSSSLIQFDDDDEDNISDLKGGIDVIRLEGDDDDDGSNEIKKSHSQHQQQRQQQSEVYSPDGDNEVEYPYESVYENIHQRPAKEDSDDDDDQVPW